MNNFKSDFEYLLDEKDPFLMGNYNFKKKMMEAAPVMDDKARAKAERLETLRQKIKAVARMQRIFSNLR